MTETEKTAAMCGGMFGGLGGYLQKAAEAYELVYGSLPEDKREVVRQIDHLFDAAAFAYEELARKGGSEASRLISAGCQADRYFVIFEYVRKILGGCSEQETLAKMQSVSDWMRKRGWRGIPNFIPPDRYLVLTAEQMHRDMANYRKQGRDARRSPHAAA